MIDAERATITEHLAEKELGWTRMSGEWRTLHGGYVFEFDPLANPLDCSLVMEAWRTQGHELSIGTHHSGLWEAVAAVAAQSPDEADVVMERLDTLWTEATCLAIYRASKEAA